MGALEQLAERSGEAFPNLIEARARALRQLPEARERLRAIPIDADASVVLFGSWGRQQLTEHSDDDWAILVNGPERAVAGPSIDEVRPPERRRR